VTVVTAGDTYYQAVEEFFVSRRGDPLFLSNADWTLVHRWRTQGLPLRIVLRGIADALDGHAHSWGRDRKVGSLRYCEAEVAAAQERWMRALGAGADDDETGAALRGFADALEGARALGAKSEALARALVAELRERAQAGADPRDAEPWLVARESELLEALRLETLPDLLRQDEHDVDATLAPYRSRMPARVLAQVRADGLARRLLERHGLSRLSLFLR
jgi:hypothetical protein